MYPQLDFARHKSTPLIDVETDSLLAHVLKNSHGQPTMSEEDTKLAILSLMSVCVSQQKLIDELVECVNEMRTPKKKFWQHK